MDLHSNKKELSLLSDKAVANATAANTTVQSNVQMDNQLGVTTQINVHISQDHGESKCQHQCYEITSLTHSLVPITPMLLATIKPSL